MTPFSRLERALAAERWSLIPLRLIVGFGFASHGEAKLARGAHEFAVTVAAMGLPAPLLLAWLTIALELGGGALLAAGAFTRMLSPPLVVVMLTALFRVHLPYGFSSVRLKAMTAAGAEFGPVGYELNLLYIAALLALALGGSTPCSFDRWRATRRAAQDGMTAPSAVKPDREQSAS